MARSKATDPKRKASNTQKSQLPSAIRRSTRVTRKRHAGEEEEAEEQNAEREEDSSSKKTAELQEAARLLGESNAAAQREAKKTPQKKRVAFVDEQGPGVVTIESADDESDREEQRQQRHQHQHQQQHQSRRPHHGRGRHDDETRRWSIADPFSDGDDDHTDVPASTIRPTSLDFSNLPAQGTNPRSTLSPSRATQLRNLLRREAAVPRDGLPQPTKGMKRARVDDETDDEDEHHHHHHHHHHNHNRHRRLDDKINTNLSSRPLKRTRDAKLLDHPQIHALPSDPVEHMLTSLGRHPHYLSLTHISQMFKIIQDRIYNPPSPSTSSTNPPPSFVTKYFSYTLTPSQRSSFPLHALRTHFVPLYMTTRFIADGSQYGWSNFFTDPSTRQPLVAAILGEWFVQRIFKHTAFGFPHHLVEELEEKDREYLHYDAVVRSKERARLMHAWFQDDAVWPMILESTVLAADALAEELLSSEVLGPLLPPPLFDPLDDEEKEMNGGENRRRDSISLRKETAKHDLRSAMKNDLFNLIMDCAALHKGIRLTGEDGTIVRFAPALAKGSRFNPTAPVYCVNQLQCNATFPTSPDDPSELRIKMTCFPRVEAIVPRGPDMAEMAFAEEGYREALRHRAAVFSMPFYRAEIATIKARGGNVDEDGDLEFSWDDKDRFWPVVPDVLQDEKGKKAGETDPETGEVNTIKRAAFVAIYPMLAPARVYCEWTPPKNETGGVDISLEDAVALARATHADSLKLRVEDARIAVWNAWAIYGGVAQWGVLVTVAVVAVCKALGIPTKVADAIEVMAREGGRGFRATSRLTAMPVEEVPEYLVDGVVGLLKEIGEKARPFGTAMATPLYALLEVLGVTNGRGGRKILVAEPVKRVTDAVKSTTSVVAFNAEELKATITATALSMASAAAAAASSSSASSSLSNGLNGPVASDVAARKAQVKSSLFDFWKNGGDGDGDEEEDEDQGEENDDDTNGDEGRDVERTMDAFRRFWRRMGRN